MKLTILNLVLVSSISFAANEFKADLTKQIKGMNQLTNVLLNLDLENSPGPIFQLRAKRNQSAFRYIDSSGGVFKKCSGATPDIAKKQLPTYSKKYMTVTADQFSPAHDKRYCAADNYNNFYQKLSNSIPADQRSEIAMQMATLTGDDVIKLVLNKLPSSELDSNLEDMNLELVHFDAQTATGTYFMDINYTQDRPWFTSVRRGCTVLMRHELISEVSDSGRPLTSPKISVELACAPRSK